MRVYAGDFEIHCTELGDENILYYTAAEFTLGFLLVHRRYRMEQLCCWTEERLELLPKGYRCT